MSKMKTLLLLGLLCLLSVITTNSSTCDSSKDSCVVAKSKPRNAAAKPPRHYNIILIGATSSFASKFLWPALFEMFRARFSQNAVRFQIYGCGRKDVDAGRKFVSQYLLNAIVCHDETCRHLKTKFVEAVQYRRLKTERDFKDLSDQMYENTQSIYGLQGSPITYEEGRLVYMSIPHSTYVKTAKYVDAYLRPRVGRPWMRVMLEKPFGRDFESAAALSAELAEYFDENEIYRIDHYLGKAVVKQILPFRYINKADYEPLWNKDHIQQVDIVMKEKDDVAGRMDVYSNLGILRDVVQNHLTELLALVAMDLPSDSGNISSLLASKARVLHQLRPATETSTLVAQYSTYNMEWMKDDATNNVSMVPTFSATAMFVDNARWSGVPFVLVSGKKLDEKSSYVRVRFRDARFCARGSSDLCNRRKQLIFNIGGGSSLRLPTMIAASRGLPTPRLRPGWSEIAAEDASDDEIFGQAMTEMIRFIPEEELNPYAELLQAALDGTRTAFVSTEQLIASWRFWTPVLRSIESKHPRQYLGRGKDAERLDFIVTSQGLHWHLDNRNIPTTISSDEGEDDTKSGIFRNVSLVTGSARNVVRRLAGKIAELAEKSTLAGDRPFHLAVSGGPYAAALFESLAEAVKSWKNVHVWLVDDRCVPPTSEHSNFNLLQRHLLSRAKIPHWNVHPIPVGMFSTEACSKDDGLRVDHRYETMIGELLPSGTFDYIVLGMGVDGHTASLFPNQEALNEKERLVTYSVNEAAKEEELRNRVTLTYKAINGARNVAVLVLGSEKREMVKSVADAFDTETYPIVGVKPTNGNLKWFIDGEALPSGNDKSA